MSIYLPKRAGGEKGPNYLYDFQLKIGGQSQRFYGSTGQSTKKAAQEFVADLKHKLRHQGVAQEMSLSEACYRYDKEVGSKLATGDDLLTALEHCCRLLGDARNLSAIDNNLMTQAVAARSLETYGKNKHRKVSPATVNRQIVEPMKRVMNRAKDLWGVTCYPDKIQWSKLKLKEPKERVREFSTDEATAFWQFLREDYVPLVTFLTLRGLRVRAAIGLQTFDVDQAKKTAEVWIKGKGRTKVPLSDSQLQIIKSEMKKAPHISQVWTYELQRKRGKKGKGDRAPITYNGLRQVIRATMEEAKIDNFRIHDFRHDFASKLLRKTRDLALVQKALGHSDIASTVRYAHVLDEDIAKGMDLLEVPTNSRQDKKNTLQSSADHIVSKGKSGNV
ncbi:MAG: site-specific integrase [Alphaproteobacteria bacterium]|nr:site-specific integrase [Alphaproteobacteria bacterium]